MAEQLRTHLDASKVKLFWELFTELISLQKKLAPSYHGDRISLDRLTTGMEILSIQVALIVRIYRAAQQLGDRIEKRLTGIPGIPDFSLVQYSCFTEVVILNHALYKLGRRYGAAKRRPLKLYGSKGPPGGRRHAMFALKSILQFKEILEKSF